MQADRTKLIGAMARMKMSGVPITDCRVLRRRNLLDAKPFDLMPGVWFEAGTMADMLISIDPATIRHRVHRSSWIAVARIGHDNVLGFLSWYKGPVEWWKIHGAFLRGHTRGVRLW